VQAQDRSRGARARATRAAQRRRAQAQSRRHRAAADRRAWCRDTAQDIVKGKQGDVAKARALYEWVVENTFR
jgi:hypothetical protein